VKIRRQVVLAVMPLLFASLLVARHVHAMSLEQMKRLAGTSLLDLRVDALLDRCGLPTAILDSANLPQLRLAIRWQDVQMKLSATKWEILYSVERDVVIHENGWINPSSASDACLSGLLDLVLEAKGDAGILTVKKRQDNQGYRTSYHIPENLYTAHQVVGITARKQQTIPLSKIIAMYGKPDEIQEGEGGIKNYRYWVVPKQKEMPVSMYAVTFDVKGAKKECARYTIQTNGIEFVQQKLEALQRQWERENVLD
jgi:hypothetical protein